MTSGPVRRFTEQQMAIARLIASEERDPPPTYAEIGAQLGISEHTVRAHVKQMALILDEPAELPPRWRILFYMRAGEWEAARPSPESLDP